jgi:DNA-binding response OmpR family regulator
MSDPTAARTLSVLIVDSDDDRRAVYAQSFASSGWQVADAESGAIALARALSAVPDVIVIHLQLVGMDSAELIGVLQRDPDTVHVPTLVVSDADDASDLERGRQGGAAVVVMATTPDALVARATELVAARTAGRDRRVQIDQLRATATAPQRAIAGPPCPDCGAALTFDRTHTTRVGRRTEQWVHYRCRRGCGEFEYRQRTRKMRKIS